MSAPLATPSTSYTIAIQSAQYGVSTGQDAGVEFLVNSGTTVIAVPPASAASVAAQFDSPAVYDASSGQYYKSCGAIAPTLAFTIVGQAFFVNPVLNVATELRYVTVYLDSTSVL